MFTVTPLVFEKGKFWKTFGELCWCGKRERIVIDSDFKVKLKMFPAWWWNVWNPWGVWMRSLTLLDWLYEDPEGRTRWECDWIFFQALRSDKISLGTSLLFWVICRLFGHPWYNLGIVGRQPADTRGSDGALK